MMSIKDNKVVRVFGNNGLLVAIIILFIIMVITSDVFLTPQNLINILSRSTSMGGSSRWA